mmetsp:Transcript_17816/g.37024  ORF Transcript_17816/g.37024 Transcript_17816/m.37024 type:complete len:107 (-) Transcript_17816:86-406(-)
MPRSFLYSLKLNNDSVRMLNVVVINAIVMQGAAAELFGGAKVGKLRRGLKGEQRSQGGENEHKNWKEALALPGTELVGTAVQGDVMAGEGRNLLAGGERQQNGRNK